MPPSKAFNTMLHNALDHAKKEKLIFSNPGEDCIIPKLEKQEMKIPRPEDMEAYLTTAEEYGVLPETDQRNPQRRIGVAPVV